MLKLLLKFLMLTCLLSTSAMASKVLVVRFDTDEMKTVTEVVRKGLKTHEVKDFIITKDSSLESVIEAVRTEKPALIVALDNLAVNYLKSIQKGNTEFSTIPGATTMALNLHNVLKDAPNICGIAFEVPAFSIVTKFRSYTGKNIQRVLTFYRKSEFNTSFEAAVSQLKTVGIELVGIDLDSLAKNPSELNEKVEKNLTETIDGHKIDAVLIPTDNIILNRDGFNKVWLPKARSLNIPFLCNIEKFTQSEYDFCSFAAYPDYQDLGRQFSEQLMEILNNSIPPKELGVDYIVATKERANIDKLRKLNLAPKEDQ